MRYSGIDTEAALKSLDNELKKLLGVAAFLALSVGGLVLFSVVNTWSV